MGHPRRREFARAFGQPDSASCLTPGWAGPLRHLVGHVRVRPAVAGALGVHLHHRRDVRRVDALEVRLAERETLGEGECVVVPGPPRMGPRVHARGVLVREELTVHERLLDLDLVQVRRGFRVGVVDADLELLATRADVLERHPEVVVHDGDLGAGAHHAVRRADVARRARVAVVAGLVGLAEEVYVVAVACDAGVGGEAVPVVALLLRRALRHNDALPVRARLAGRAGVGRRALGEDDALGIDARLPSGARDRGRALGLVRKRAGAEDLGVGDLVFVQVALAVVVETNHHPGATILAAPDLVARLDVLTVDDGGGAGLAVVTLLTVLALDTRVALRSGDTGGALGPVLAILPVGTVLAILTVLARTALGPVSPRNAVTGVLRGLFPHLKPRSPVDAVCAGGFVGQGEDVGVLGAGGEAEEEEGDLADQSHWTPLNQVSKARRKWRIR